MNPGQLADNLETTSAHLDSLWRQVQDRGLYDAGDWRQALATVEELAAVAARVDPEIASQLREAWDGLRQVTGHLRCPKTSRAVCNACVRWSMRCGHYLHYLAVTDEGKERRRMLSSTELLNYMESRIPDGQKEDWGTIIEAAADTAELARSQGCIAGSLWDEWAVDLLACFYAFNKGISPTLRLEYGLDHIAALRGESRAEDRA